MTEADALAYLNERSEVRRCLHNATITEILEAYFGAVHNPLTESYTFPDGARVSAKEILARRRFWLNKAIEIEVPYGPIKA